MRQLHDHKITPANERLTIEATDEPGAGGANHRYSIRGFSTHTNPSADQTCNDESALEVLFQNGTIPEAGNNGVTEQALVAIVMDRLRSFQAGPFACRENALALTKLEEAMMWMHARTLKRVARGVEGKHVA